MNVVVFTGPTISAAEGREILDAEYLPPVAQSDVYRAARKQPFAIGIIDGYFERVPSVWHKEILWAMSQGVHIYGSASMGALRAVELAAFGMEGVGSVFEAYRRGELLDDDEVAVAHGPADRGFAPTSEAMVNIRATLAAAEASELIGPGTHAALVKTAKAAYYPDRNFPTLLRQARHDHLPAAELDALEQWLPEGRVDQKRADAVAMLRKLGSLAANGAAPKQVNFDFVSTSLWGALQNEAVGRETVGAAHDKLVAERLLEELRLVPAFERIRARAQVAILARRLAQHAGISIEGEALHEATDRFWSERGIGDASKAEAWMAARGLDEAAVTRLIEREAYRRWGTGATQLELTEELLDETRLSDDYERVVARALDKQRALDDRGLENIDPQGIDLTDEMLLRWWFEDRVGTDMPLDLHAYTEKLGYVDEHEFQRALVREYCYTMLAPGERRKEEKAK
jgi:hypothetical protein